jgi:uncharacterized protein involved in outer membrane biogenesis
MKKLVKIVIALLVLLLLAIVATFFFIDSIVKAGVEKVGPVVTKTPVKLDGARLSLFSGRGELKGFFIGNPEGFKSPSAITVGQVAVSVQPGSVLSSKVVVHSVTVNSPEITFEGNLTGNNLSKLLDNIKGSAESDKKATSKTEQSSQKKLQVDEFLITGAKVHLAANLLGVGGSAPIAIPEIHLSNLGQGPEGITAAELADRVFSALSSSVLKAVAEQASGLGKNLGNAVKGAESNAVPNVTKGISDLFKKK